MQISEITTLITTVGFPIVCAVAMGWFIFKAFNNITNENKEREKRLYKMVEEVRTELSKCIEINASFIKTLEALDNNIKALSEDVEDIKNHMKE